MLDIAREQYREGEGIYEISVALGLEPREIKESLTANDNFHHFAHTGQVLKDEFDEIRYAFSLIVSGRGRIVNKNGNKYTQLVRK